MEKFNQAVNILSAGVKSKLILLPDSVKKDTYEIRLRVGKPIILCGRYGSVFLDKAKGTSPFLSEAAYICKTEIISDTFNRLCRYSVYSHIESIIKGYITFQGGHRAGLTGTANVSQKGEVTSVNEISGINIRIAREIIGSADLLMSKVFSSKLQSIIIAGPPSSGKTTILRDVIRQLSNRLYKISVIDERQELAAMNGSISENDLGINTDVYNCYPKSLGIMNAVKTMSPDIIAVDEIGREDEVEGVRLGANSGVNFITTLHASSYEDMLCRPQLERLLSTRVFSSVVLLKSSSSPCEIEKIFDAKELYGEICRSSVNLDRLYSYGNSDIIIA